MTLWLLLLVPVTAGVIAARARRFDGATAAGALAATAALGVWAAVSEPVVRAIWGPGLELNLAAAGFARVMIVLVPLIALPIVLYAAATKSAGRSRLVGLLTVFVAPMELLVLADDLLTLLIGWELVGALSWILIAHERDDASNGEKASHAFLTTRFGDLGLYVAAGITFASTGSFRFSAIGEASATDLQLIAAGLLLAAAAKSAQVPFSPWLFSAMAGPTPVSALLHSSTMVAAGAYLLIRLGPEFSSVSWWAPAVIAIGLTSALAGGIVAAVHRHPKRLLAASTTAQYGLMFVAAGAGSVFAAAAQLVAHAAFKSLLFLSAGTAMHATHSEDIAGMRLGGRLPAIGASAAVGALALGAVPPLGGAWTKEQVAGVAFEEAALLGVAVLVAGALSAFYAMRYWLLVFGRGGDGPQEKAPPGETGTVGFLAVVSLGLAILWIPAVNRSAADLMAGHPLPMHPLEFALSLLSLAVAGIFVFNLARRDRLGAGVLPPSGAAAASRWFEIATASRRLVADPVLAVARAIAVFDDRVIDAGIRTSARIADRLSGLLRKRWEISIDALVEGVARGALVVAARSGAADDRGVDRAVEGIATGIGRAGALLRRMQTGLSHHYYLLVGAGVIVVMVALAVGTS